MTTKKTTLPPEWPKQRLKGEAPTTLISIPAEVPPALPLPSWLNYELPRTAEPISFIQLVVASAVGTMLTLTAICLVGILVGMV